MFLQGAFPSLPYPQFYDMALLRPIPLLQFLINIVEEVARAGLIRETPMFEIW